MNLTQGAVLASVGIAFLSLLLALRAERVADRAAGADESSARAAIQANAQARLLAQTQASLDFNARFTSILQGGYRFEDPDWSYRFWNLLSMEFYFFDNGWLPNFIYRVWMVELAFCYCEYPHAWESHNEHFKRRTPRYPRMKEFFSEIHARAEQCRDDLDVMAERVERLVSAWPQSHGDSEEAELSS